MQGRRRSRKQYVWTPYRARRAYRCRRSLNWYDGHLQRARNEGHRLGFGSSGGELDGEQGGEEERQHGKGGVERAAADGEEGELEGA
jgi:hypothetical protein